MNTSTQEFTDTGSASAMPMGNMRSDDGSGMPGGDMNAAPARPAGSDSGSTDVAPTDEMPTGAMLSSGFDGMPAGAMLQAAAQEMPAETEQGAGDAADAGMPTGGMLDTGAGGMPMGAMLSATDSGESWNMDVVSPEHPCAGC